VAVVHLVERAGQLVDERLVLRAVRHPVTVALDVMSNPVSIPAFAVTPPRQSGGMTSLDLTVQLIARLAFALAASLGAGLVTYVFGVWLLRTVVSIALQTVPAP